MSPEQQNQLSNNRRNRNLIVVNSDVLSVLSRFEQQLSQARRDQHNWNDNLEYEYQLRQNTMFDTTHQHQIKQQPELQYVETSKSDSRFLLNQYRANVENNENRNSIRKELIVEWLFRGISRELDKHRNMVKLNQNNKS